MPYTRLLHSLAGTVNLAIRDHALGVMTAGVDGRSRSDRPDRRRAAGRLLRAATHRARRLRLLRPLRGRLPGVRGRQAALAAQRRAGPGRRDERARDATPNVHGEPIAAETLWSCTTCGACPTVCPLGISPMRMITDMRRHLIGEGALRGSPATALQKTDRAGNPWGMSPERTARLGRRPRRAAGQRAPRLRNPLLGRLRRGVRSPRARRSPAASCGCCRRPT